MVGGTERGAVLLDTLLVRTLVVPAVALLLGDRFWWPRTLTPAGYGSTNLAKVES